MKTLTFMTTLLVCFLLNPGLNGQSFNVEASYDTVYLGNTVEVRFVAENMDGRIESNMQDLPVIAGPNQRSSTSIINGAVYSSKSFTYILEPTEAGILEIPAAYLYRDDGEVEETMPLSLLVLDNPNNIIQREEKQRNDFFFSDPFYRPLPRTQPKSRGKKKRQLKKI